MYPNEAKNLVSQNFNDIFKLEWTRKKDKIKYEEYMKIIDLVDADEISNLFIEKQ